MARKHPFDLVLGDLAAAIIVKYLEDDSHVFVCEKYHFWDASEEEFAEFYLSRLANVDDVEHVVDVLLIDSIAKILLKGCSDLVF